MKELSMVQDPAAEMGGGEVLKQLTTKDRANAAYERVAAVFRNGVQPTRRAYMMRREDGASCACAIGALAVAYNEKFTGQPGWFPTQEETASAICGATSDFKLGEVLALERGFMYPRVWRTKYWANRTDLIPFHEAGERIALDFFTETEPVPVLEI